MQSVDLVTMNASEDDKIKAMMDQSTRGFDQSKYVLLCPCVTATIVNCLSRRLVCTGWE